WSERGFLHQHWDDLLGRAELELHTGDAAAALQRLARGWRSLKRAFVLEIQICREEVHFVRGRAYLRRAQQVGAATSDGRALIRRAAADAARLRGERVPYIAGLADLLAAGVAAVRGDAAGAAALLHRSIAALDATGLALHAAVARLRLAAVVGGSAGDALRAAAQAYAVGEGVTAVAAVTEHLAPGFAA
ncbi:MAG TPA: hypothetical protein VK607_03410, partial [Kofleriaceae bacterium]|nr:hypothetical protein [Kofleriaceae bacterium]